MSGTRIAERALEWLDRRSAWQFVTIWLNSLKFGNFKDADGKSAVPYLLVFETK